MKSNDILTRKWNNILILGDGYLGNEIFNFLKKKAYNLYKKSKSELDYNDSNSLGRYILNNDINLVINCSGFTGKPNVDEAEHKKQLCWQLNVVSPLQVAKTCNGLGVKCVHVSSGCIYSGYSKHFVEEDTPNFGLFNESSFYSKSKHAFETLTQDLNLKILRIRMPICYDLTNPRNYLNKIMKYPNLIDFSNSKTFIPDLCGFIDTMLDQPNSWWGGKQDIYNIVNPEPLATYDVVELLNKGNEGGWRKLDPKWITLSELDTVAPRSNCVLNNNKASKLYQFKTETQFMWMIMNNINGNSAV